MTLRIISILTLLALLLAPAGLMVNAQDAELQLEAGTTAAALEANIGAPASGYEAEVGQSITFTGSGRGGLPPYALTWKFGDGSEAFGTSYSKTYTTAGTYTVELTVTDFNGVQETDNISVTIKAEEVSSALAVRITAPTSQRFIINNAITFTAVATGGLAPYAFTWDFGDSSEAFGTSYSKTYSVLGEKTVTVTATDFNGTKVSITKMVNIVAEDDGNPSDPLMISNIRITDITQNSAIVRWTTNRNATSRVIYDTVSHSSIATSSAPNFGYANSTGTSDVDTKVIEHTVNVTGLAASTSYFFRVISQE